MKPTTCPSTPRRGPFAIGITSVVAGLIIWVLSVSASAATAPDSTIDPSMAKFITTEQGDRIDFTIIWDIPTLNESETRTDLKVYFAYRPHFQSWLMRWDRPQSAESEPTRWVSELSLVPPGALNYILKESLREWRRRFPAETNDLDTITGRFDSFVDLWHPYLENLEIAIAEKASNDPGHISRRTFVRELHRLSAHTMKRTLQESGFEAILNEFDDTIGGCEWPEPLKNVIPIPADESSWAYLLKTEGFGIRVNPFLVVKLSELDPDNQ